MPNWCECKLKIEGKIKELENFERENSGETTDNENNDPKALDFNKSVPMPEELQNTHAPSIGPPTDEERLLIERLGARNWDVWQRTNWGVKWGAYNPECQWSEGRTKSLIYLFDTPWGPPIPWVEKVSLKYPTLKFTLWFDEPGLRFKGKRQIKNGTYSIVQDTDMY